MLALKKINLSERLFAYVAFMSICKQAFDDAYNELTKLVQFL